jgi:hypothetical protein
MPKRATRTSFQKGRSGNPGGITKEQHAKIRQAAECARQYSEEAIRRLAELMHDSDGRVACSACNALLDRAWGRPKQTLEARHWMEASGKELAEALPKALAARGISGKTAQALVTALGEALEDSE